MSFIRGFNSLNTMKTLKFHVEKSMQSNRNLSTCSSSFIFNKPMQQFHNNSRTISPLQIPSYRNNSTSTECYKESTPFNFGIHFVPQQQAYVVERLGKYSRTLHPGFNCLIPIIDKVRYVHSLKEQTVLISKQTGITKDNVPIEMDGILYVRIIDPVLASYGTEDPVYAVVQLAQTVMRAELGKISLDKTFEERVKLNKNILDSINDRPLRTDWGIECLRYEIKDITPPKGIKEAMEKQAEAERKKRAKVLISEGKRQAEINVADGKKMAVILESEAAKKDQVNRGKGEADAILANAQATAKAILEVSNAILENGGTAATSLKIAEQYIEAFEKINKVGNVVLIPEEASDSASLISQGVTLYNKVSTSK